MELGTLGQTEASIPMSALLSLGIELVVCFHHCPACPECIGRCFWGPLVQLLFHRRSWAGTHPAEWLGPPSLRWLGSPACLCDRRCPCLSVCLPVCLSSPYPCHLCPSVSVFLLAGYENYGYGYGYGQDNTTNYGYGMATSNSWEMPSSDTNANPSAAGSASADSVLSRINQRLDMVPHLETDMMQGGVYGSGGER